MPNDDSDLLELLKSELSFLEQGGYGRSVKTPWRPTTMFRDSTVCLNFNDPARPHPCGECALMQFAPPNRRDADLPCHHILLDSQGHTVEGFEYFGNQQHMEEAVGAWLRKTIASLEQQVRAQAKPDKGVA